MAATLAMSGGGGQEDPFYPLQKATLPAGFPLEDSALFGLDCKITDKPGQNDYTQVNRPEIPPTLHAGDVLLWMGVADRAYIQVVCLFVCFFFTPLASKCQPALLRDVNEHFALHYLRR